MRLTTDFFIAAVMRDMRARGGFAYLVRRGADAAGVIFFLHRGRNGINKFYGPAAQSLYDFDGMAVNERLFTLLLQEEGEENIVLYLEKELRFDPDIWLVEIENFDDLDKVLLLVEG